MSEGRTQNLPGGDTGEILSLLRSIDGRLTALEEKVDRRLQEARPIYEVYDLNRKFSIFNKDILKLQDRQEDLKERLDRIDTEHAG